MGPPASNPHSVELDDFIKAYEVAQTGARQVDLTAFLPQPNHPLYEGRLDGLPSPT
jgi:hypothetical protein